jgi:anti-sigma regulatory factor (Ser/Thr protein kinase)
MAILMARQITEVRVPLWLVVVRESGRSYVEVLAGGGGGPLPFTVAEGEQAMLRTVRHEVSRYLTGYSLPVTRELRDDVVLCANEAVTNALVHTASRVITLTVEVLSPDARRPVTVQVVVGDEERRRRPARGRRVDESFERGRGLHILDELASWGCRPRTHGKELWFRCPRPANEAGPA